MRVMLPKDQDGSNLIKSQVLFIHKTQHPVKRDTQSHSKLFFSPDMPVGW